MYGYYVIILSVNHKILELFALIQLMEHISYTEFTLIRLSI